MQGTPMHSQGFATGQTPTMAYPIAGQATYTGASTCPPAGKENVYEDEDENWHEGGYYDAHGEPKKKGALSKVKDNIKGMLGMKKKHEDPHAVHDAVPGAAGYPGTTTYPAGHTNYPGTGHTGHPAGHTGHPAAGQTSATGTTTQHSPFLS
jgi:hypothetical protein